jgi:hypothetical protein
LTELTQKIEGFEAPEIASVESVEPSFWQLLDFQEVSNEAEMFRYMEQAERNAHIEKNGFTFDIVHQMW